MILRGGFESFLERSVCSRRRKMDRALYRSRVDVESTRSGHHFCRQPHNRRLVANMIVVESVREHLEVGFCDYARLGIPITILNTIAGVIVLLVLR
jgi:hypothetical protein